ncbi:hypothetical protein [Halomonas sp.]|uniref:hypothetical protein n=1 Tax=Halomonas sp. TaxID=1486246 RepID=UPI0025C0CBBE|nr:hypothetical protein [Halomonas sp.]
MFDIVQPLRDTDVIETGVVVEFLGDKKYRVSIKGKDKILQSVVERHISIGDYVVVNKTNSGSYIVGATGQLKTQHTKEVIVNA